MSGERVRFEWEFAKREAKNIKSTHCVPATRRLLKDLFAKKHTSKSYRHLFFPTHCSRSNSLTNSLVVDFLLLFVEVEPLLVFINVAAAAVVAARTIAIILLADAVARPPTAP